MLRQTSLSDLTSGRVSRRDGFVVIAMRRAPRYVRTPLRDLYTSHLAPDAELLNDFLAARKKLKGDHNTAFNLVCYEERFELGVEAITLLRDLADRSRAQDVYLACQCSEDERCHRDLLLILARRWFRAGIAAMRFTYPIFEKRIR